MFGKSLGSLSLICLGIITTALSTAALNADAQDTPQIHFRPAKGVLGDTIPFYWRGVYHIFYLKGQRWGHIACKDLVHWKELPDALDKGDSETSPDGENCWTGSIVAHEGMFHLFYTGKNSRDPKGDQKVMHATSKDLIVWTKHPEHTFYADGKIYWSKPVNGTIDDKLIYHHQAFRDPEVFWNAKENRWGLLLHAALADGSSPVFAHFISSDLYQWEPIQPIMIYPKNYSGDCPNLFQAGKKWYIIAADRHYTSADALEGPYNPEMVPYEYGELFVPKTMFDGKRRLLAGWIGDRQDLKDAGSGVWGGTMSMVREIYPDAQGRLCQRPPREILKAYRKTFLRLPDGPQKGLEINVPPNYLLQFQIASTTPDTEAALAFRLPQNDPAAGYRLKINFGSKEISLGDRSRTYQRICDIENDHPINVKLFLDDTVAECFINDAYCFTMRTFDALQGNLKLDTTKGDFTVKDFTVKVRK